jgi:hypothetical protein
MLRLFFHVSTGSVRSLSLVTFILYVRERFCAYRRAPPLLFCRSFRRSPAGSRI